MIDAANWPMFVCRGALHAPDLKPGKFRGLRADDAPPPKTGNKKRRPE